MKPQISIIVPIFNAEDTLNNVVNSFVTQDIGFEMLEIILIDDNSTDNSKFIIQNFVNKYKNVKGFFLDKNNGTPGKLRNIGIKNAVADYIMFCDSDDTFSKDFCRIMYDVVLKNPNVDFISSRYKMFNENKFVSLNKSFLEKYPSEIKIDSINDFPDLVYTLSNLPIWNKIFKRDFILKNNIKFYDNRWDEDFFFSINCFIKSQNGFIFLNDYAGYNYAVDNIKFPSNKRLKNSITDTVLCFEDLEILLSENSNINLNFEKLISEHLVNSTQYFLGNSLPYNDQIHLLKKLKPYYKMYKLTNKLINNVSWVLNFFVNIFIKLAGLSINFVIFVSKLYKILN